jgi:hypothetical protein
LNKGNLQFEAQALPWQAQLTAYRDAVVIDANHDGLPDLLMAGNYYGNNIQMGRYDADFGTILINKGRGNFEVAGINGVQVKGQVRHIRPVTVDKRPSFLMARNNDSAMIISFREQKK